MRFHSVVRASVGALALIALDPAFAAWSRPKTISGDAFMASGSAIAAAGSAVHVLFTDDWRQGRVYYVRSLDCGRTWSPPARLAQYTRPESFAIVASGDDLHVVYSPSDGLFYRRSSNGGRSWSFPLELGRRGHYGLRPAVAADGEAVVVAWRTMDHAPNLFRDQVFVDGVVSTDSGQNWKRRRFTRERVFEWPRGPWQPVVAVSREGAAREPRFHVAWPHRLGEIGEKAEIRYRWANGGRAQLSAVQRLTPGFEVYDEYLPLALLATREGLHLLIEAELAHPRQRADALHTRSADGGASWTPLVPANPWPYWRLASYGGDMAIGVRGNATTLHATWAGEWVARSRDSGETWASRHFSRYIPEASIAAVRDDAGECAGTAHLVHPNYRKRALVYRRWPARLEAD